MAHYHDPEERERTDWQDAEDADFEYDRSLDEWPDEYDNDLGGTGHGDISYSDADPGL